MGLDMYLTKKVYIGANYEYNNITGVIDLKKEGQPVQINLNKVTQIVEEVGYWRKANQIHQWFVDNVQEGVDNCSEFYVSINQLEELLKLCKEVKEKSILVDGDIHNGTSSKNGVTTQLIEKGKIIQNASEIADLLPVSGGFFFGSENYDEYYMNDIDHTIEMLEEVLKENESKPGDYYYGFSW